MFAYNLNVQQLIKLYYLNFDTNTLLQNINNFLVELVLIPLLFIDKVEC